MPNRLTIKEMAKKAGVSVATISRAMEPHTRSKVAPETLKYVDALVKKYGYTSNVVAKHLRQSATKTIGIVFPYVPGIFFSEYYTGILAGAAEFLLDTDYRFKMLLVKEGAWRDGYHFRAGEGVDALMIVHWFKIFSNQKAFERLDVPHVVMNDYDPGIKTYFVYTDQFAGGRMAAQYFYEKGHRHVMAMTGPSWSLDSRQRLEGFQSYWREHSMALAADQMEDGRFLEQEAYFKTEGLLKKNPQATAIFCCNDQMAFGVIRKLRDMGISCPEQMSVMGYDNEKRCVFNIPSLTSIHVDVPALSRAAAQILLNHLQKGGQKLHGAKSFLPKLMERGSSKDLGRFSTKD